MNQKNFRQKSLSLFIYWFVILFIFVFQMSSCKKGDNAANQSSLENSRQEWLKLNIKFKAGSTESSINGVIKEVEGLINSVLNETKRNEYPNYNPILTVNKGLFQDSLSYQIHVTSLKDNIHQQSDVYCKCITGCRICRLVDNLVSNEPTSGSKKLPNSKIIESIYIND